MENVYIPVNFAPANLNQPILPNSSFSLFNINLGISRNASFEHSVLQNVGSYGKQIGHLAEALELVITKLKILESGDLSKGERDTVVRFLNDVAAVRELKGGAG